MQDGAPDLHLFATLRRGSARRGAVFCRVLTEMQRTDKLDTVAHMALKDGKRGGFPGSCA